MSASAMRMLTPAEVAARLALGKAESVRALILTGHLKAFNVSNGKRPTWRISPEDLEAFLESRRNSPLTPKHRRRDKQPTNVTHYF